MADTTLDFTLADGRCVRVRTPAGEMDATALPARVARDGGPWLDEGSEFVPYHRVAQVGLVGERPPGGVPYSADFLRTRAMLAACGEGEEPGAAARSRAGT